eukprot:360838-Chlamydomonas_euryale.AAC.2
MALQPPPEALTWPVAPGATDITADILALHGIAAALQPPQRHSLGPCSGATDTAAAPNGVAWRCSTLQLPHEALAWPLALGATDNQPPEALTQTFALGAQVNELLAEYAGMWDALVDAWLVVRIGDPQWVFQWRLQAEERMRATGRPGMSDDQIADFVSRFQPAYQAYLGGLYAQGPTTSRPGKTLVVEVDQNRSPLSQQPPRPSSFA